MPEPFWHPLSSKVSIFLLTRTLGTNPLEPTDAGDVAAVATLHFCILDSRYYLWQQLSIRHAPLRHLPRLQPVATSPAPPNTRSANSVCSPTVSNGSPQPCRKSEWHNLSVWFLHDTWYKSDVFSSSSVYDKTDLLDLAKDLADAGVWLLGSGRTAKKIREAGISIEWVIVQSFTDLRLVNDNNCFKDVSDITKAPEILGGRVKTLHPAIHGGTNIYKMSFYLFGSQIITIVILTRTT